MNVRIDSHTTSVDLSHRFGKIVPPGTMPPRGACWFVALRLGVLGFIHFAPLPEDRNIEIMKWNSKLRRRRNKG
jgi:hypothetical protein